MVRFTDMFTELVRVEIELWNGLDVHLAATAGVSLPQYQALAAVSKNGAASRVQDISAAMSITVGAASKVVDRLERDGLAVRSAHPTDRRSSLVSVTERGARALEEADDASEAHLRAVLSGSLSEARVASLYDELVSLRAHSRKSLER